MSHLIRVGVLLALFLMLFLFVRSASTMITIDAIGLVGGNNAQEWASLPVQNQEPAVCEECHQAINTSWTRSDHIAVTCENCHGATKEHIELAREEQPAPLVYPDARDLCRYCHEALAARPSDFPQVNVAEHSAAAEGQLTACTTCHNPHRPGVPPFIPHELELPPNCLTCHGKDRWVPVSDAHVDLTNADCLACHRRAEAEE